MIKKLLYILYIGLMMPVAALSQINTDRVMTIGKNALYFEDYVLSIQYFNQVINAKPYLAEPFFYRGLAKINLDDFQGAESDCTESIERNPFVANTYQIRGISRIRQDNFDGAIISTVVPQLKPVLKSALEKLLRCPVMLVSCEMKRDFEMLMDNPSAIGADLICGAAGAVLKYSLPSIVFDLFFK